MCFSTLPQYSAFDWIPLRDKGNPQHNSRGLWRRKYIGTIISSLVTQKHTPFFQPKKIICQHRTRIRVCVRVFHRFQKYAFLVFNVELFLPGKLKYQCHNNYNRMPGEITSCILKLIIILWFHMVGIYTKHCQAWPWQKCVPSHLINMLYLTESACCVVVINFPLLSYPSNNITGMK